MYTESYRCDAPHCLLAQLMGYQKIAWEDVTVHISDTCFNWNLINANVCLSDWFKDTKTDAAGGKDWVFLNYTFKRFEGLTQRGVKLPLK